MVKLWKKLKNLKDRVLSSGQQDELAKLQSEAEHVFSNLNKELVRNIAPLLPHLGTELAKRVNECAGANPVNRMEIERLFQEILDFVPAHPDDGVDPSAVRKELQQICNRMMSFNKNPAGNTLIKLKSTTPKKAFVPRGEAGGATSSLLNLVHQTPNLLQQQQHQQHQPSLMPWTKTPSLGHQPLQSLLKLKDPDDALHKIGEQTALKLKANQKTYRSSGPSGRGETSAMDVAKEEQKTAQAIVAEDGKTGREVVAGNVRQNIELIKEEYSTQRNSRDKEADEKKYYIQEQAKLCAKAIDNETKLRREKQNDTYRLQLAESKRKDKQVDNLQQRKVALQEHVLERGDPVSVHALMQQQFIEGLMQDGVEQLPALVFAQPQQQHQLPGPSGYYQQQQIENVNYGSGWRERAIDYGSPDQHQQQDPKVEPAESAESETMKEETEAQQKDEDGFNA